jgi:hypothetical protein
MKWVLNFLAPYIEGLCTTVVVVLSVNISKIVRYVSRRISTCYALFIKLLVCYIDICMSVAKKIYILSLSLSIILFVLTPGTKIQIMV